MNATRSGRITKIDGDLYRIEMRVVAPSQTELPPRHASARPQLGPANDTLEVTVHCTCPGGIDPDNPDESALREAAHTVRNVVVMLVDELREFRDPAQWHKK